MRELLNFFIATCAALVTFNGPAAAGVIFQDNFDQYTVGSGDFQGNWTVTNGTVDLIGGPGFHDFYPGNGHYVDLDGSSNQAGVFSTTTAFAAGSYELKFSLGDSPFDTNLVDISLGDWQVQLVRNPADLLDPFMFVFSTTGGVLTFHNLGGDNSGAILDNVQLSSVTAPEPCSFALLGVGGLGLAVARRRRMPV